MSERVSYHFSGVVTALAPISHLGTQHGGTVATLNRQKVVQPDGTVEEVPVVSGNSFRGQLRDAGMRYMLDAIGLRVDLPAFHFLFSGGMLTKGESPANVRTGDYRRLRELVPLVSVFGGAIAGQIMAGKLDVGQFMPICAETVHLLPPSARRGQERFASIYDYLQIIEYTRTDNSKQEAFRYLMEPRAVALLEGAGLATLAEEPKTQQMRYGSEVFAAGTPFWHEMTLRHVSNLERESFLSAIAAYLERPTLGGKGAIGLGRVSFDYEQASLETSVRAKAGAIAFGVGQEYLAHLQANAGEISGLLARMAA